MNLVLIPDKFKGSLSAAGVCDAIAAGIRVHFPDASIRVFAASDGGDGFLDAIRACREVEVISTVTSDPLGRPISADFLYDPETREAYVEMARASGMVLLSESERDPLKTSTRGTGRLIRAAISRGAATIYVGLGGSATTDGAIGIAAEFGYGFQDASGKSLDPVGGNLERIVRIMPPGRDDGVADGQGIEGGSVSFPGGDSVLPPESGSGKDRVQGRPLLQDVRLYAVNDVINPLWGPEGAAYVYAPQKGAGPAAVALLDRGLRNLDTVARRDLGATPGDQPGAGAAGGTAYGLRAFFGAEFISGTEFMFRMSGIEKFLDTTPVSCLVTGEGRFDSQSLSGKLIQGVIALGTARGIPVIAVCGSCEVARDRLEQAGLAALVEAAEPDRSLAWNMEHAADQVRDAVAAYFGGPGREIIGS